MHSHPSMYTVDSLLSRIVAPLEYADPEHLCKVCLPVHGDSIVGTRRCNQDPSSTVPIVHRMGCPHAQQAINRSWANQRFPAQTNNESNTMKKESNDECSPFTSFTAQKARVDSFTLRQSKWINSGRYRNVDETTLVKLEWSDLDERNTYFLAEIVIVAEDRKKLLADCSEVVSDTVEIVKTGSVTTNEHATLVFLVQVTGLDCIQKLMDKLCQIRSVMSVERRFGSELLT